MHGYLIMGVPLCTEPLRSRCQDCRGKGFDLARRGERHARRCQRCRGRGFTEVGRKRR